jgi:hypothetical protein
MATNDKTTKQVTGHSVTQEVQNPLTTRRHKNHNEDFVLELRRSQFHFRINL